jgi:transcriptional regulator with XRE-family HTH domain
MSAFGQKVKEARQEKHMSQEELAFRSGLHRTYISSIERGKRNVSLVNIRRLANALGVPLQDLIPIESELEEKE